MSEEPITQPEPAPEPPKLPESEKTVRKLTFSVPHILKSLTLDENGFLNPILRQGGLKQIEHETIHSYSEQIVPNEAVFLIRATNQFNFANTILNVINDEIALPNGFQLVPTSPTASGYLEQVGTRQLIYFNTLRVVGSSLPKDWPSEVPLYKTSRIFITLP